MSNRPTVLFVDDEERILRSLCMLFRSRFNVLATTNGHEAVRLVRQHKVHVIVSDQRMPEMEGIEVLRLVREASPNTMRLLLTGYADLQATIGSINEGEVFRYLTKPWDMQEIIAAVSKAAEIAVSLDAVDNDQQAGNLAPGILVIDEDRTVAEMVRAVSAPEQPVAWSMDLEEAFDILSRSNVAIVICDVRLNGRNITEEIKALKQTNPAIVTIVQTQLQDVEMLRGLINYGQIYRFLPKPARRAMLEMSLNSAGKRYAALQAAPATVARYRAENRPASAGNVSAGLSGRVAGYLDRMRQRVAAQ
ncbi:MAG: response regulator [Alcanivorax sp.]|nr:response regulator [Alcanivorax sp.]